VQESTRQPATPTSGTNALQPDQMLVSRFPRLYIVLISLHGLVRGERMELGRDPDTGGQVRRLHGSCMCVSVCVCEGMDGVHKLEIGVCP